MVDTIFLAFPISVANTVYLEYISSLVFTPIIFSSFITNPVFLWLQKEKPYDIIGQTSNDKKLTIIAYTV